MTGEDKSAREMRHITLQRSLRGIGMRINELEDLLCDVRGDKAARIEGGQQAEPPFISLSGIISEAPDILAKFNDRLSTITKEMTLLLF